MEALTKILLLTDSPVLPSGLANTVRNVFPTLLKEFPNKYDLRQIGFFHRTGSPSLGWPIIPTRKIQTSKGTIVPDRNDTYGELTFDSVIQDFKPDIVWGYGDLWHFQVALNSPLRNRYRMVAYYTVDGEPYNGSLTAAGGSEWGRQLARADQIVTMTDFGKRTLERGLPELANQRIQTIYHPIQPGLFPEVTVEQKSKLRQALLGDTVPPDAFVCGWVGRNQFRKQNFKLWEVAHYMVHGDYLQCQDCNRITLREWDPVQRQSRALDEITYYDPGYDYSRCWHCKSASVTAGTPDPDFYLWLHMPKDDVGYSHDLEERYWALEGRCQLTEIRLGQRDLTQTDVVRLLNCFDCLFYPSGGEGFGIPVMEAMAARLPILFSNYSAHAEFARYGGLAVRVRYQPDQKVSIRRAVIETEHAVEQMLKLRHNPGLRMAMGLTGRAHVEQFTPTAIAQQWDQVFTDVMQMPESNVLHGVAL